MVKSRWIFLGLFLCAVTVTRAATTLLDGNYFAFKPTSLFAIKESGRWALPRFVLRLGMEKDAAAQKTKILPGYVFVLDATKAGIAVPQSCQQRFSSVPNQERVTMTMPSSYFDFGDVEQVIMFGERCAVTVWISGQRSYWGQERFEGSDIVPPQEDSISHGLVEFRAESEVTLIQFAIPVQDL